jgi:hypothetical protein
MLSAQSTSGADPIFGAIENHRRAHADFCETALAADEIDTSPRAIAARQASARSGMFAEERYSEASNAELAAKSALLAVEPTTIVGAIELLRYAGGRSEQSWEAQCFRHVAEALSSITARGADRS